MRVLLASSELEPYSKTGGLADMTAALGKYLARAGHQVGIVTPLHRSALTYARRQAEAALRARVPARRLPRDPARWEAAIEAEVRHVIAPFDWVLDLPMGSLRMRASVRCATPEPNLTIYFVDAPGFFDREGLYLDPVSKAEYWDNPERYLFFAKAVTNLARYLPWQPEIVHLHDWHTGLVPLFVRHQAWQEGWSPAPKTILTIHNLAPQGRCHGSKYALTNLPPYYFHAQAAEFWGDLNPLKAGLVFADALTTVSPTYAREITTPQYGEGLDSLLLQRQSVLSGILNGVDYEAWRTVGNPHLPAAYHRDDLAGKPTCKAALQAALGLPVRADVPLFGTVTRLDPQKGVDLILGALEEMLATGLQYVLLGSGRPDFELEFADLARRYPKQVAAVIGYQPALAHQIEAGADFYLMPSRFEPCGLNQMYSLRYGAIPVVRATGGLQDSIVDLRENPDRAEGIKFLEPTPRALAKAMRKALALWQNPPLLARYRYHGMSADFSWERSVRAYEDLFSRVLGR
jgi:starch synthase